MTLDELPFREREALQQTLLEGEQVVWLGRPQPYLFSFVSRSLALVTVFWCCSSGGLPTVCTISGNSGWPVFSALWR
jgi:hypothetical protein